MREAGNILRAAQVVVRCEQIFETLGISVSVSNDLTHLKRTSSERPDKDVMPLFDVSCFELLPGNAFWVEGRDGTGQLAFTSAVRLDDLGSASLAELWWRRLQRFRPQGIDVLPKPHKDNPLCQFMGRIAHLGEVWVSKRYRDQRLENEVARISVLLSALLWRPDYIIAIADEEEMRRGVFFRNGFFHGAPIAREWRWMGYTEVLEPYLVWLDDIALRRYLRNEVTRPSDQPLRRSG